MKVKTNNPKTKKIHTATRHDKINGWTLKYSELAKISEQTRIYEFSDMEIVESTILAMADLGYMDLEEEP